MQQPLHEAYTDNEKKTLRFLKEYDSANKEIEAELFDAYRKMNVENPLISDFYRFGHLQKLQDKIQKTIQQLGNLEEDYLKGRMKQGLVLGIETVINKIPETELNKRAIDQMIMRPWQGGNFSDRVWKNKSLLANQLNDKLRNGIIQGKSPFKIANDLSERMQVGRYQAQRLVRTEYMHVLNQGQIEGYKAKGYTKLKWHASKDERTCEICGKHHGNEYEIDAAPHLPAHPGCRCTFVPVIDVESAAEELKQAKDELNSISERSIIELEDELYRKKIRDDSNRRPISDFRFNQLTISARKNGAMIIKGGDWANDHLDKLNANAAVIGDWLIFRDKPTLSETLEETYHFNHQILKKVNFDKDYQLMTILNEIDAKEYLIRNKKKYNIPRDEDLETRAQLEDYKRALQKWVKENGEFAKDNRTK